MEKVIHSSGLFTTPGKIQKSTIEVTLKKSLGIDKISNLALKLLPKNMIVSLTAGLNSCLRKCLFPSAWKKAIIIPIHKPGKDHNLPENYRPIALHYQKFMKKLFWTNSKRPYLSSSGPSNFPLDQTTRLPSNWLNKWMGSVNP